MARRHRNDVEDGRQEQPYTEGRCYWCQKALGASDAPHDLGDRKPEHAEHEDAYNRHVLGSLALAMRVTLASEPVAVGAGARLAWLRLTDGNRNRVAATETDSDASWLSSALARAL